MAGAGLRIHLIGAFEVEGVADAAFGSRKARLALKRLALGRGKPVAPDALVDALWDDDAPARPHDQVAVLVSRLRATLGADRITRIDAGYALHHDWLDLVEFETLAAEASTRSGPSARSAALSALARADGTLLAGEDGEWVDGERRQFERRVASTRARAAELLLAAGQAGEAAALAEATLDQDQFDEVALRTLMRAHARAGRGASALAVYARTRALLADELGVDPTEETEALHTALLLGSMDTPTAAGTPSFAGRAAELAILDEQVTAVTDRAVAVLIVGEAGIGKTALVAHWTTNHVPPTTSVITGRCDELGRDLPLQPVLDALADHMRGLDASDSAALLGDAAALVGPLVGRRTERRLPTDTPTVVADPEQGRIALFQAVLDVIERVGDTGPTLLVVEDLHGAGDATLSWLRFALRRGSRLVIVATTRPGPRQLVPGAHLITLPPLEVADVAALVGPERASEIHVRTAGNPLYVMHLAASDDEVPAGLVELIRSRAAALGPAGTTLHVAAILDQDVDVDLVAAACRAEPGDVLDHIEASLVVGLLRDEGGTIRFAHTVVREALAADTTAARRALAHRAAAAALRSRRQADPLRIALHARLGGDVSLAAAALVEAAGLAAQRFDLEHAQARLDEALELEESTDALVARARVCLARSNLAAAAADVARAIELRPDSSSFELAGWIAYYARDFTAANAFVDTALARADDDAIRASSLTLGGRIRHSHGDLSGADEWLTSAATHVGPSRRAMTNIWLGCLRAHQGRLTDALELLASADIDDRANWSRMGHPFVPAHGLFSRVQAYGMQGRLREALDALKAFDEHVSTAGTAGQRFLPIVQNMRGWLARIIGDAERATECFVAALGVGVSELSEPHAHAHLDLAELAFAAEEWDVATIELRDVEDRLGQVVTMRWHVRQRVELGRARLALAAGDASTASLIATELQADARLRGSRRYEVLAAFVAEYARVRGGERHDPDRLQPMLDDLLQVATPESWWLAAQLGASTGLARWWDVADDAALALVHGLWPETEQAESLRRHVDATFNRLGRPR